ncbi:MAG: heparinase II/III family protein [Lentisphaeria bacterium]|nr:heparinase II/III family protein [Lentisphaeria bacterium]
MSAKEHSRFVTGEMRANALANIEKNEWAQQKQQSAVRKAQPWLKRTDDALWAMVPSQELPRTIYTNAGIFYKGEIPFCPHCGKTAPTKYGRTWWNFDGKAPWKIRCRNCSEVYPKNDFAAFYKTALDEHGMFRKALGDRTLLFNADHPDPNDPLHTLYVDDGYGMRDEKGKLHHAIAYYCFQAVWRTIQTGLLDLAHAYTLTGDRRYAHKAAVLLDRIADVYPEMNYLPLHKQGFQHSHGGPGLGRIEGCIWECFVVQRMARSYDLIFDGIQEDEELAAFCAAKAKRYKLVDKGSVATICGHIEDHLLLEALESCKDGRIAGNTGMTHAALATCAIALDRPGLTEQWLDWLFDPQFPGKRRGQRDSLPWVLIEGLDRDGMGGENGSYGLIWSRNMHALVDLFTAYPEYTKHNLVKDYPKLKQSYFVESRLSVLDGMMPNTGDTGSVARWSRVGSAVLYVRGYELYQDARFANLAWREHTEHQSSLRLKDDVFRRDPDALIKEIKALAQANSGTLKNDHFGRYGQACLQTTHAANGRAVFIHYGHGKGHSHHDCLNLGLLAKNVAMIPDLGYPEYTGSWPKRHAWTANTISHNTLQIGDAPSAYSPGGKIGLFAAEPPLRLMQVDAANAYKQAETYQRTVALIDIDGDNSYVFDVFRARGGTNHRLSWHGAAESAKIAGLTMVAQKTGTFAGTDIPFAKLDGKRRAFLRASGFSYLRDVERSSEPVQTPYTVDWKLIDKTGRIRNGTEPHLRLHALTPCDEVALATGEAPHKKLYPRYLIQSRLGANLRSQFVNVLEPYDKTPFITKVRQLPVEHDADADSVTAVAVELTDGRTDILIACEQPTQVKVDGRIDFHGGFGMIRLDHGVVRSMRLVRGTLLACDGVTLTTEHAEYRGRVSAIDASNPADNRVTLDPPLPQDASLVGSIIHFVNALPLDTSYDIRALTKDGVSTGDITIVRGLKSQTDFAAGYTYLVNPGDTYIVPTTLSLDRGK